MMTDSPISMVMRSSLSLLRCRVSTWPRPRITQPSSPAETFQRALPERVLPVDGHRVRHAAVVLIRPYGPVQPHHRAAVVVAVPVTGAPHGVAYAALHFVEYLEPVFAERQGPRELVCQAVCPVVLRE